jgi:predicted helicase
LTNALEEAHPHTGSLFATWLSAEAQEANDIKKNTPVMVVMGNPPYSVSSSNKGEWILELIKEYKKDLNEKKINLDDDYIKFIRYAQHFIDKNGQGIVAMITNNSFIDGITHRQMRKSLSESFDKIYIYDLHGASDKREVSPDGSEDENVFDIKQGVSINIFVRTGKPKSVKSVVHLDSFGKREQKYEYLWNNSIKSINWTELSVKEPEYFFIPKDYKDENSYKKDFSILELMTVNSNGIETQKDELAIQFTQSDLLKVINDFENLNEEQIKAKYKISDGRDWRVSNAKKDIESSQKLIGEILYRPFDWRKTLFTFKGGFIAYPRINVMKHLLQSSRKTDNYALVAMRQYVDSSFSHILLTRDPIDNRTTYSNRGKANCFPLYLYSEQSKEQTSLIEKEPERRPNLKDEIVNEIANKLGLKFTAEKLPPTPLERGNSEDQGFSSSLQGGGGGNSFAPIDLLDYIYAVLHSPSYREKYKEFLKVDFPRVPYPDNQERFWKLVEKGSELRELHLLESSKANQYITSYPQDGSNQVEKVEFKDESKVYINSEQYFDNVPKLAWEFYIGGYQPAQKWLKDRKGRELSYEDILHYQKVIVALTETDRLMKEIDDIGIENAEFAISAGGRK